MYRVIFDKRALKELESVAEPFRSRIASEIDALSSNPRPHGAIKLQSRADLYRVRIGNYRVIYSIRDEVLLVLVVRVADRKDVYD